MTDIARTCLVSGADGFVTVTPAGRIILTEAQPALRGEDLDRIADEVGMDVALRTVAANGGTAAMVDESSGPVKLTLTGRVGALIELPTAEWFVSPTGADGHTVTIPGDALRFAVGIGAGIPTDLTPNTAASISTPEGQVASQFVIDLRVDAQPDPTPVGLEVLDLSAAADVAPAPLPLASQEIASQPPIEPPPVAPEPAAPVPSQPAAPAAPSQPSQPAPPAPVSQAPAPGPGSQAAGSVDESDWVVGIRCPLDHHNHPEAGYCSQCGRKMGINATIRFQKGPRPPLGLFLLDDGGAIPIATDLLIGRDATTHSDVIAGTRQAVLLTDASNVVSRHHLAITLEEWTVTVADLGSANGTIIVTAKSGLAQQLVTNQPVPMEAGDRLQIGPRTLQLELHHVAVPQ
ncbi:MAG: FHA domain-containing protein [Ilumatobacter sp.]